LVISADSEQVQDLLLPLHKQHAAAVLPGLHLFRWSWGSWGISKSGLQLQQTLTEYLKVEQ